MTWPEWTSPDGRIRLIHADCLEVLPSLAGIDAVVTDPPYGIGYESGMTGHDGGTALPGIQGDDDTSLRDAMLRWWGNRPALVFGTWKRERPVGCRLVLTWDKGEHVGMGDLETPWKPNTEEIYVLGRGFSGRRGSSVLRFTAPVTWNSMERGRKHPHEKPIPLMASLVAKCPGATILDPFAGSCTAAIACIRTDRRCICIEKEERYWQIGIERCQREYNRTVLFNEQEAVA